MKRKPSALRVARYLEATARRLRRGAPLGDKRILADLLNRAVAELRKAS